MRVGFHTTYRNLGEHSKLHSEVWDGAMVQIDFYALLGLEMMTDGDNSH